MKTTLSYLPQTKQEQILRIVEIIKEVAAPEKIILFGSYANGKYVEHRYTGSDGIIYEYISDYDFLVVTKDSPVRAYDLDDQITTRTEKIQPALNVEIHEIDYINEGLEFGQYFFSDIVKEGILLYDTGNAHFAEPKELTSAEEKVISQRYFDIWLPGGSEFLETVSFSLQRGKYKIGAFLLHQATESFYYATLLVFTGYKPKTHNLKKLRKQAKHLSEELFLVFPIETNKQERHLFDLLKRGYIDARYRTDYLITEEELIALITHIKKMQVIVEQICRKKIESFEIIQLN
ncbi:MAG: HEPN domain-containing protein [Bacteroidota bacterium]|nr:HEPN domain-containing protein [Bacteroidota bacterium]